MMLGFQRFLFKKINNSVRSQSFAFVHHSSYSPHLEQTLLSSAFSFGQSIHLRRVRDQDR